MDRMSFGLALAGILAFGGRGAVPAVQERAATAQVPAPAVTPEKP